MTTPEHMERMEHLVSQLCLAHDGDFELVNDDLVRILRDCADDEELMQAFAYAIQRGLGWL